MSLRVNIKATNEATPVLAHLHRELTDRTKLHQYIAAKAESETRIHIRNAAKTRHETANRLGAPPTNYLAKRAELVEAEGYREGVTIQVTGAIFRRVFGPVTVRAKEKKALTIPWRAEAYGRRAGEFEDLFVYVSKRGQAFLAKKVGKQLHFYYILKRQVELPQDRGLLPTEERYGQIAEVAARALLRSQMRELGVEE